MKTQIRMLTLAAVSLFGAAGIEMVDAFPLRDVAAGVLSVTCWIVLAKMGFLGGTAKDLLETTWSKWTSPSTNLQPVHAQKNMRTMTVPVA